MQSKACSLAFAVCLLAAVPASGEIIKGVMAVKGAEMSWWGGVARDAIARQYDVDKNLVTLTCEDGKGGYRPGLITFQAKKGKSIDVDQIRESITATRLSGGTNMGVDYLEITAIGDVTASGMEMVLKVAGTGRQYVLAEDPERKAAWQGLHAALARGEKVTSVTGRLQGWSGRFPDVLRALANTPTQNRMRVMAFEMVKK